jgi:iron complex outermembrane receptor protein
MPTWQNNADISLFLGLPVDGCGFTSITCQIQYASASSKSDSFFFEGDFNLTDDWILTAGARYIKETKTISKYEELPIFGLVSLPRVNGKRTDDDTIYRLGLRWEPREDLMTYFTYSTGFRSGGFSIRGSTKEILETGYEPETVDSFEWGLKSTMLDSRVRFNFTLFHMIYDDMQIEVNIPLPGLGTGNQDAVLNVGKATLQGAEMELTALMGEYFSLDFNAGYLDAEYDRFNGKLFAVEEVGADHSDLDLRRAPKWNYTAALNYQQEIGAGTLNGRVSYNWRDDYEGTASNFPGTRVDSFGLLDASLSYEYKEWRLSVFGRNLTDETAYQHTFVVAPVSPAGDSLFTFANPRPPRHFGVEVTYTFGDY